jgi:hypothetical protein
MHISFLVIHNDPPTRRESKSTDKPKRDNLGTSIKPKEYLHRGRAASIQTHCYAKPRSRFLQVVETNAQFFHNQLTYNNISRDSHS